MKIKIENTEEFIDLVERGFKDFKYCKKTDPTDLRTQPIYEGIIEYIRKLGNDWHKIWYREYDLYLFVSGHEIIEYMRLYEN